MTKETHLEIVIHLDKKGTMSGPQDPQRQEEILRSLAADMVAEMIRNEANGIKRTILSHDGHDVGSVAIKWIATGERVG